MSKRQLQPINLKARDDIGFEPAKSALAKWNRSLSAAADEATITIYDIIGRDEWGGVSAKRIASALRAIGDKDVTVNVNSPGGDVFEGIAIYNLLAQHKGQVTVRVIGIAASAASVIAMAGDKIEMGPATFMMIHNVWALAMGNRHDMRDIADWMEPFDDALAEVYAVRTGADKTAIAKMMDTETWMNGTQAVDKGFADSIMSGDAVTEDEKKDSEKWKSDASALVREFDTALLTAGTHRNKRMSLTAALRNQLDSPKPPAGLTGSENQQLENGGTTMTTIQTPATPATPAAAAPAANTPAAPSADAIADAVKADRTRGTAIMALDETKGREKLAQLLVNNGTSVEDAKALIAASPKASKLDEAMNNFTPNVQGQEVTETEAPKLASVSDIYARRQAIFNGKRAA